MKRTAAITLLCMGAGAVAVASAFEEPCDPQSQAQAANRNPAALTGQTNPTPQSCRSGGHGSYGGHGGFFSRVARGGFGRAGRGSGG